MCMRICSRKVIDSKVLSGGGVGKAHLLLLQRPWVGSQHPYGCFIIPVPGHLMQPGFWVPHVYEANAYVQTKVTYALKTTT